MPAPFNDRFNNDSRLSVFILLLNFLVLKSFIILFLRSLFFLGTKISLVFILFGSIIFKLKFCNFLNAPSMVGLYFLIEEHLLQLLHYLPNLIFLF